MKLFGFIPAGVLIVQGFLGAFSMPTEQIDVAIRIFAIPSCQDGRKSEILDKDTGKGFYGSVISTAVAWPFPDNAVIIPTSLDELASDTEIKAVLNDHGYFTGAKESIGRDFDCFPIGMLIMDSFVAADGLGVLKIRPAGAIESKNGGEELRYNLVVQTKSWNGEKALLNLKFELETWIDNKALENTRRTLLDQDVGCSKGKVLLVGFPTDRGVRAGQSKGMIYFLAVTVHPESR